MIKLLREDYDLTSESSLELANMMDDLCHEYDMCYHEMSTETERVWSCIERIASEIVRRKTETP